MRYLERRIGLHLFVVTVFMLAVAAALVVEGLGFALIVAMGYPLVVMLAESHDLPISRRRR